MGKASGEGHDAAHARGGTLQCREGDRLGKTRGRDPGKDRYIATHDR